MLRNKNLCVFSNYACNICKLSTWECEFSCFRNSIHTCVNIHVEAHTQHIHQCSFRHVGTYIPQGIKRAKHNAIMCACPNITFIKGSVYVCMSVYINICVCMRVRMGSYEDFVACTYVSCEPQVFRMRVHALQYACPCPNKRCLIYTWHLFWFTTWHMRWMNSYRRRCTQQVRSCSRTWSWWLKGWSRSQRSLWWLIWTQVPCTPCACMCVSVFMLCVYYETYIHRYMHIFAHSFVLFSGSRCFSRHSSIPCMQIQISRRIFMPNREFMT